MNARWEGQGANPTCDDGLSGEVAPKKECKESKRKTGSDHGVSSGRFGCLAQVRFGDERATKGARVWALLSDVFAAKGYRQTKHVGRPTNISCRGLFSHWVRILIHVGFVSVKVGKEGRAADFENMFTDQRYR